MKCRLPACLLAAALAGVATLSWAAPRPPPPPGALPLPPVVTPAPAPAQAPTPQALQEPTAEQLRLLFLQMLIAEEPNPPQQCLDQALRLNYGLMALRFAKATPDRVQQALLRGAEGAELEQRRREAAIWTRTTAPGIVARSRFSFCLEQHGLQSRLGEVELRCFQMAGVPAVAQLRRAGGAGEADTLAQLRGIYGKTLPVQYLQDVNSAIYRAANDEAAFGVHRALFGGCLGQAR